MYSSKKQQFSKLILTGLGFILIGSNLSLADPILENFSNIQAPSDVRTQMTVLPHPGSHIIISREPSDLRPAFSQCSNQDPRCSPNHLRVAAYQLTRISINGTQIQLSNPENLRVNHLIVPAQRETPFRVQEIPYVVTLNYRLTMFAKRDFFLLIHGASVDVSSCTMVPEPNDHAITGTLVQQGVTQTCSETSHVLWISCNLLFETPMRNQATIMNHFLDMTDYDTRTSPAFFVPRQTISNQGCVDLGTPQPTSSQSGSGSTGFTDIMHSLTTIGLGNL